jgi:4a-hydroxytetrahydrobiopterin dehydratase
VSLRLTGLVSPCRAGLFFARGGVNFYSVAFSFPVNDKLNDLANKKCEPCEGGALPLTPEQARKLMDQLHADWKLSIDARSIGRMFEFKAFSRTIAFVNAIAFIATNEGHHPELIVNYGSCEVNYTTTAINGLSDNDFICAAKIDRLAEEL